jgi:hypothetical protein
MIITNIILPTLKRSSFIIYILLQLKFWFYKFNLPSTILALYLSKRFLFSFQEMIVCQKGYNSFFRFKICQISRILLSRVFINRIFYLLKNRTYIEILIFNSYHCEM